jgi:hypothetical protein
MDVLRGAGTYSESEQRAKYRANGKLAARRSLEDFTKKMSDLVGPPTYGDRRGFDCASVAYCPRLCTKFMADLDCRHLRLGCESWRNSWQQ